MSNQRHFVYDDGRPCCNVAQAERLAEDLGGTVRGDDQSHVIVLTASGAEELRDLLLEEKPMAKTKAKTDCFLDINPYSGFTGSHNGRCAAGATAKLPHSAPTHHVRVNGWCGEVCGPCATQYGKRKDATVRQIAVSRALDIFAED